MSHNKVLFKGRQGGITIALDPDSDLKELKELLKHKLIDAKDFFKDSTTSIAFDGKELTATEEDELLDIIRKYSDINISFFMDTSAIDIEEKVDFSTRSIAKQGQAMDDMALQEKIIDALPFTARENQTLYHHGSLRSGQSIEYKGTVVIMGDVNPGAEIIAEAHIIILGSLKGLVHAGCRGLEGALVIALDLQPIQLRIGSVYTYIPTERQDNIPSLAYVENNKIFIRPLMEI